jgi:hypothetical protein
MIYQEITENKFIDVMSGEGNYFSRDGAKALYNFLEELDNDTRFDPIALRCQFSEYDNIEEFCAESCLDIEDHQSMEDVEQHGTVIMIDEESFLMIE